MTRRPANRSALKRRLASRASRQQVAYPAEVADQGLAERLGLTIGTTAEGLLLMSRSDWRRALDGGAVVVEDRVKALSTIQFAGVRAADENMSGDKPR